ncbi:unnamed protein product, partial [Scytosiphon promiscuus]
CGALQVTVLGVNFFLFMVVNGYHHKLSQRLSQRLSRSGFWTSTIAPSQPFNPALPVLLKP